MAFLAPLAIGALAGGGAAAAGVGTLAAIGTGVTVAGTALSGINAMQQASYQAKIAKNDQIIAQRNAQAASTASQIEARRSDLQYAELQGQQLALQGASGLDVLGASQLRTRGATSRTGREQALDINSQGLAQITKFGNDFQQGGINRQLAKSQKSQAFGTMVAGIAGDVFNPFQRSLIGKSRSLR